ncbi:MAG: hypothetical protein AAGE86_10330 [Pseudomonadota bacterium]
MQPEIWIGIAGTVFAMAFLFNGWRMSRGDQSGHAANAGRLHIVVAIAFLPFLWMAVVAAAS